MRRLLFALVLVGCSGGGASIPPNDVDSGIASEVDAGLDATQPGELDSGGSNDAAVPDATSDADLPTDAGVDAACAQYTEPKGNAPTVASILVGDCKSPCVSTTHRYRYHLTEASTGNAPRPRDLSSTACRQEGTSAFFCCSVLTCTRAEQLDDQCGMSNPGYIGWNCDAPAGDTKPEAPGTCVAYTGAGATAVQKCCTP